MAKGKGQDLVYVDPNSVKALQKVAAELSSRADGKALKKELNKRLRTAVEPMRKDQQQAARDLAFSNKPSRRARRTAGVTATGRARKGKGLRQEMAQTIRTTVSTGKYAGVRVQQRSTDRDVNRIAKALNRQGKVRHPLFGDTNHWYDTVAANAKGWFYAPFDRRSRQVTDEVRQVLDQQMKDLARDISRKS